MSFVKLTGTLDTVTGRLTLKGEACPTCTCLPYSTYHRSGADEWSHGLSFVIRDKKLVKIEAQREVDPEQPTASFESSAAPASSPPAAADATIVVDKAMLAKLQTQLQGHVGKPAAFASLDVRNQVAVPMDPKQRLAIYDALPVELRPAFTAACEAADKRKGK